MGGAGPFVGSGLAFLLNSVAISRGGMRIKGEAMLTLGSFFHVGSRRADRLQVCVHFLVVPSLLLFPNKPVVFWWISWRLMRPVDRD